MKRLLKIAWRNVWRNRLRSLVVMLSIVLGLWAGMFITAMSLGMNEQRMEGAINSSLTHIQIHHPDFELDFNKKLILEDRESIIAQLDTMEGVLAYASHVVLQGMSATAKGNYGTKIIGIIPSEEKNLTNISGHLVEGTYLNTFKKNPIVVGQKLADQLGVKVRSKVVLSFQDKDHNTISKNFRVDGIFKTVNSSYDASTVFVRQEDIVPALGIGNGIHEILIKCTSMNEVDGVKERIKTHNLVESWAELSPELGYAQETMGGFIYIFMGIILMALSFGIINTMLMAILERKRELGMLISIGMNKFRIFSMIILETLFLVAFATPIGIGLSYVSIRYFEVHGIDLSVVAVGLESFGMDPIIYTTLPEEHYFNITLMTLMVAFLSAIVPARKALKINPSEAIKAI